MINLRKDLALKYYLNLHLNGVPDRDAILFEIINYVLNNNVKDKEAYYKNVKFSTKTLKYIFGEKFDNEDFKNSIISNIKESIQNGEIDLNSKTFHITENGMNKFYEKIEKYNT